MTETQLDKREVLRLNDVVVKRIVPMNDEGCDALRALQEHFKEELGDAAEINFPVTIHLSLVKLCHVLGINYRTD